MRSMTHSRCKRRSRPRITNGCLPPARPVSSYSPRPLRAVRPWSGTPTHQRKKRPGSVHRSCFRDKDNDYRALVGRANRWFIGKKCCSSRRWDKALRLGRALRGRIRTGERRNHSSERLRRAAGTYLRLHGAGDPQRPHLASPSRCWRRRNSAQPAAGRYDLQNSFSCCADEHAAGLAHGSCAS